MNYREDDITTSEGIKIYNYLAEISISTIRDEILTGLRSSDKYISSKYFYDEIGSKLFEEICKLDEYYPNRTETGILSGIVRKLKLDFDGLNIFEFGSGDHTKISTLLRQIPERNLNSISYYPIDISISALKEASEKLSSDFPQIIIYGYALDFLRQLNRLPKPGNSLYCFLGSTIGNFEAEQIKLFIETLGSQMLPGDSFILGLDMVKDIAVLEKAYNDAEGVTAEFNRNILNNVNNLCETDFDPAKFDHFAFFNKDHCRIEMHLKAKEAMIIRSKFLPKEIHINEGEMIHTENSYKFDTDSIKMIGNWGGLDIENVFSDENKWFSLVHFRK